MNYYLNALNEMRRQQQNNMMGGGGYQGVGSTPPSGPLGLGQAQDRSSWRDAIRDMNPLVSFAMSRVPGVGLPLGIAKAANYGLNKYEAAQLAATLDARQKAQEQFRTAEITAMNAPQQNTPQQSFQTGEKNYGFVNPSVSDFQTQADAISAANLNSAPSSSYVDSTMDRVSGVTSPNPVAVSAPVSQSSFVGESLAPMPNVAVSSPVSQSSINGTALGGLSGGLQGGGLGSTGLYGDASAGMDGYGGFNGGGLGGSGNGPEGVGGDFGLYAKGGMVDARHLKGRAPAPDDGYGGLQGGEYVITKAAVEKYGKRLLDAINNGTFKGFTKTI